MTAPFDNLEIIIFLSLTSGANCVHPSTKDTQHNNFHEAGSLSPSNSNESDNFSDIDDVEVKFLVILFNSTFYKDCIPPWHLFHKSYEEISLFLSCLFDFMFKILTKTS